MTIGQAFRKKKVFIPSEIFMANAARFKRIYLHIGCEKTGSTSIQEYMDKNRKINYVKHSVYYPYTLGNANHTKLGIYVCNSNKNLWRFVNQDVSDLDQFRSDLKKELFKELSSIKSDYLVLSNEWLHPRVKEKDEFNRLKDLLNHYTDDIRIILYLRRQDKLALSLYSTALKGGGCNEFCFPNILSDKNLPYFYDFLSIYNNWVECFGADSVLLRAFDKKKLVGNDIVSDFLDVLGIRLFDSDLKPKSNKSLSDEGVALMRSFNYCIANNISSLSSNEIKTIRKKISYNFQGAANLASEEECLRFLRNFHKSNDILFDLYYKNKGEVIGL